MWYSDLSIALTSELTTSAYSSDAVYLYSVRDDPQERVRTTGVVPPNRRSKSRLDLSNAGDSPVSIASALLEGSMDNEEEEAMDEDEDEDEDTEVDIRFRTPIVLPRRKYVGACNTETVKDGAPASLTHCVAT